MLYNKHTLANSWYVIYIYCVCVILNLHDIHVYYGSADVLFNLDLKNDYFQSSLTMFRLLHDENDQI